MRKKIILIVGIIVILVVGGIIGNKVFANNGNLKIPKTLELKDEYKKDLTEKYIKSFNQCISNALGLYKNIDSIKTEDLIKVNDLGKTLLDSKSGSKLTNPEMILAKKVSIINGDIVYYGLGSRTNEDKTKLQSDIKMILDCYK